MRPEVVQVAPRECPEELVARVCDLLRRGGLVALPTETVYGIAARLDGGEGERRLRELKGRDPGGKAMTLHLGEPGEAATHAPPFPNCAHRLARRYWPGSLTLIVPGRNGDPVGLRVPSRLFTRRVLTAAGRDGSPIAMPSANLPGTPPACTAAEVVDRVGERVDLVVDGGPAELGEASTVVRAIPPRLEVVREGTLRRGEVERTACWTVLFLCTGNTCRSPMAELLARALAAEAAAVPLAESTRSGLRFLSAGTSALSGLPASGPALAAMAEAGLDLNGHGTRELTRSLLQEVDLVLAMTAAHAARAEALAPGDRSPRVEVLSPLGEEVLDPFGGDLPDYRRARDHIRQALEERLPWLLARPWEETVP